MSFCPKPVAPTLTFSGVAPCIGDTVSYTIAPIPGATSYRWIISGGGWTGQVLRTSITLTAGSGTGTVVALAYNSCGEGESNTFTVNPATVPPAPFISVYTPPCTGVTTAVFTASGLSGFSWSVVGGGGQVRVLLPVFRQPWVQVLRILYAIVAMPAEPARLIHLSLPPAHRLFLLPNPRIVLPQPEPI